MLCCCPVLHCCIVPKCSRCPSCARLKNTPNALRTVRYHADAGNAYCVCVCVCALCSVVCSALDQQSGTEALPPGVDAALARCRATVCSYLFWPELPEHDLQLPQELSAALEVRPTCCVDLPSTYC